ncbi:leucyl aminopeptidase [Rhodoferax sediminis]|uniref:Probable cytosol aminopeptidase n=1 Tax=Rhodoferax sediminis TaxID=2509614 RepID=A0A515DB13_9BURK|nr:leucyl aminopeptidase [Rhodoferax sediminis]QDL37587.1 leucyl aminopeptidase [Rhodoferax sediminis]
MNFELKTLDLTGATLEKCDALIVLVTQTFTPGKDALGKLVGEALKTGDLETKPGKLLQLYRCPAVAAPRAVLAGAGDGSARQVRLAVQAAVGAIKSGPARRVSICFVGATAEVSGAAVRAAVLAAADASYVYTSTKPSAEGRKVTRVMLGVPDAAAVKTAFEQAVAVVVGVELTKEWGNRPANHATPTLLADAAKALGKLPKVKCEVLGPKEVAKLGMGAFIAVAKGSEEPLRFIVLKYEGAAKAQAPVVLVGKGISFDTGGISIKQASEMDEMKFDMCGAASVLGVFRALAELKPALNVVGLIASCENMPDGRAVKPGDVVTSMSGQTIEVLNTDAEGRLVLCDALTYAERFKPRAVIDIATLTGACIVALGNVRSGLFSSDEALAAALLAAGENALDPCWRLPLDDEYAEGLKTNFADVANVAGRAGGAITAAKFLQRFSGKFAWAHLDIAGTAWKGGAVKGATARPVGLLLAYLLDQAVKEAVAPVKSARSAPKKVAKSD